MAIENEMIDIIVEQLSVEKEKVVPNASFVDDLGADSLDLVELIMAMEEGFDIEIPDEDVKLVAEQVGCSLEEAEKALIESKGDIAEAIIRLRAEKK